MVLQSGGYHFVWVRRMARHALRAFEIECKLGALLTKDTTMHRTCSSVTLSSRRCKLLSKPASGRSNVLGGLGSKDAGREPPGDMALIGGAPVCHALATSCHAVPDLQSLKSRAPATTRNSHSTKVLTT